MMPSKTPPRHHGNEYHPEYHLFEERSEERNDLIFHTPYLSLVIPLYNEERCLKENFAIIEAYLKTLDVDYEIILVDDGSTDRTEILIRDILRKAPHTHAMRNPENRGKGNAVKAGVLNATGRYVVYADADLAVPVEYIGACLKRLEAGMPVVIGSRHLPESSFKIPEEPLRQFLGEIFRRGTKRCLGLRVSDITCGLKGFERKAAVQMFSRSKIDRWGYDAEIIFLGQKLGFTIDEIPVDWYHSFDSKVKMGSAVIKTLTEMLQILCNYLTNRYHLARTPRERPRTPRERQ